MGHEILPARMWDAIQGQASLPEVDSVSLFSRLRAVVSGDDYLDGDFDDELDYDPGDTTTTAASSTATRNSGALALSTDFSTDDPFAGTNVIGMPGITSAAAEVCLM